MEETDIISLDSAYVYTIIFLNMFFNGQEISQKFINIM